ncbi:MAG TPA: NAD(P)H-dependent oxidoreductase [Ktedonobacterales bacterium]
MKPQLLIILGSTRQNRYGEVVAHWVNQRARTRSDAIFELADLKEWALPFLDSPLPPALGQYDEATRPWAKKVDAADGYVFVTPEYNHGYPAVLKNALDHLYREWGHKPGAIVSYGATTGAGYRAAEQLRQVLVELRMVPLREQVGVPTILNAFDEHGRARDAALDKSLDVMLNELVWWAATLMPARATRSVTSSAA